MFDVMVANIGMIDWSFYFSSKRLVSFGHMGTVPQLQRKLF